MAILSAMFQDAYIKCDQLECETLLETFNPYFEGGKFSSDRTVIMRRPLAFYPGYTFYDISDQTTMPARRRFVIAKGSDVVVLDFTNEPIYALNSRVPLFLTPDLIADYVRFFFSYIRGRHGRFQIVETVDDIQWREDPPPSARKAIGMMLSPIVVSGFDEDRTARLHVQMMFKDTLFKAGVEVTSEGQVTLSNETLLVEEMPVLDDTFGY